MISLINNALPDFHKRGKSFDELINALTNESELHIFGDDMFQFMKTGYGRASIRQLANWLCKRSEIVGAQTAINNLQLYLETEEIPYFKVVVLAGVTIEKAIVLTDDIELIPFADASLLRWKEHISKKYEDLHENYQPQVVLRQNSTFRRMHGKEETVPAFENDLFKDLEDIHLCMTIIGPCAPVILGKWIEPDEWVPAVGGSSASIEQLFNVGGFNSFPSNLDSNKLNSIFQHWAVLPEKEKKHLRIALKRLNAALRKTTPVDSAIDLGIALESIFLTDREPDRGELTFTLRLRAARLLGNNEISRIELSKFFGTLYKIRSAAVHTGIIEETYAGLPTRFILDRGYALAARAIEHTILNGKLDWQSLVFG